ncbi:MULTISPECIES: M20 family metallopeptidase [Bradyrhizobium]|jgi:aminobenzoyl-glutamate utilization protein B|uniref:Amidohydrolase n=2 Tax=Bradyrhizobium TaxID=374 RepID=A0ABS5G2L7_9BRAD|nr:MULTISPECIES: M20 family metallopeptidase [Bradyrhizobium]RTL92130.1 MAG: amidohydrolase [Bradyrhizobiaceae bacterium]ABQ34269.1 putative Peptidase M20D, amidohydrolase [Bradyrhizobium sp. BTAi1]MBR1135560.1 amidohydrolase [Bradyrhizobium denitrificans]MCL8489330.1 M20 family metallopeptidase [Bradyrhizobium denitrificans]MDU1494843.1 M20 family metallopeptidase [Bradyrhizobium sp.]
MDNRSEIWRGVDAIKTRFIELSDRVWGMPEVCYTEARSCAEHLAELKHQGFRITEKVGGIPTALMGEWGEGGPVIAFMGEYDALPGLSQEAGVAEHRPVETGGHGHGCGHNLLGSAALLAATAVKDWLAANKVPGRVRYYGCPAEEGGAAKAFMVRSGAFEDADIAITWHPSSFWEVVMTPSLANTRADFIFTGRTSHAAASPHLGRSALDAVELMNVGVNYMREHMPSDARVHYALLDTGGIAPNVVQAHARVRYSIRARDLPGMNELVERVRKIAQGAAMMTETKVEMKIISAVSNILPNTPLEEALYGIMEELGPPHFDENDRDFAGQIQATLTEKDIESVYYSIGMEPTDKPLADFLVPLNTKRNPQIGSTDVGDVSWVVPTVQVHAPTVAIGTPFHTWQVVAQGKSPAAHKAMVQAAKAMAGLGIKALNEPALIAAAKADLNKRTLRTPYVSPLPADVEPPLTMSVA